jgi:AcrR family transcriptional regulator
MQMRKLPPGRHRIPVEQVERSQHERLVASMAEASAEGGYLATSVSEVSARAGVSTQTFYKLFSNKLDCMLASYEEALARLFADMDVACGAGPTEGEGRLRPPIHTALTLLAADPTAARLLTVEIMAAGPEGARRHYRACECLATRLHDMRSPNLPPGPIANWALVATMAMRIAKEVTDGRAQALGQLEDEFVSVASMMGLGT